MSVAMEDFPRRHRITVDEYHRMAEVGLLAPKARVELIDGEIIEMPPIGNLHKSVVDQLNEVLHDAVGRRAIVRCQGSFVLGDYSEPQPDFLLLVRRQDFYKQRHATETDTLLAIEVSDTSLRYDLHTKKSLYERHGVREYWVIDTQRGRLHIFRMSSSGEYEEVLAPDASGIVPIPSLPGVSVDLSFVLRQSTA